MPCDLGRVSSWKDKENKDSCETQWKIFYLFCFSRENIFVIMLLLWLSMQSKKYLMVCNMKKQLVISSCFLYGLLLYLYVYCKTNDESNARFTISPLKLLGFDGDLIFSLTLGSRTPILSKDFKNSKNIYFMNMSIISTFTPLLITSLHVCEACCSTFHLVSLLFFQHLFLECLPFLFR